MIKQTLLICLCALVSSAPQNYGVLKVQEPEPKELGAYENVVAATIDVLPEIADVFEGLSASRGSLDPTDSDSVLDVILAFLPISERVLEAMAKAEGRTIRKEERERLHRIRDVLPSYFAFMENIGNTNFYGFPQSYSPNKPTTTSSSSSGGGGEKESDKAANNFSGSFVKLPVGKSYFISHGGEAQ